MRKRAPAVRAPLEERVKVHDRNQLELKLEYQPTGAEAECKYVVEAYVCMPASLNISAETLPSTDIYADIHNYVRLKTPEMTWPELRAVPDSPLVRLGEAVARVEGGERPDELVYLCKLTASVFRASLRDAAQAAERAAGEDAEALAEDALDGSAQALATYRRLADRASALPEDARYAYALADEAMSLSVEHMFRRVLVAIASDHPMRRRLLDRILEEEAHRRRRGYPSIIDPETDNEEYIHRSGILKKLCSSVLFLRVHQAAPRISQEVLFALAAGIAMAFATVVAFWAQTRYGSLSLSVFFILVVAYMAKDRIKEGARGLFARVLKRYLYDRRCVIDDPAGVEIGTFREKVEYVTVLPEEVRRIRRRGVEPMLAWARAALAETTYRYRKQIVLESRRIPDGLTDILRFHVGRLLRDMDEPDQEIGYVELDSDQIERVRAAKTYRVDVVFLFHTRRDAPPRTLLARLVLDRNGIKRIEEVQE
ncbi:MAG TPA: hypothetical protein VKE22_27655 [Haliangiales bacterium]|nr:hypothetical protein [Haliangiales bacterium]